MSYPQYSRYESGDQLPSLEQALAFARLLKIPPAEALLEWSRCQVQDPQARRELQAIDFGGANQASEPATKSQVPLDDVIVFNRSHLKVFESDSAYRDIFTYVNSFAPEAIEVDELACALKIESVKLLAMLEKLCDLGVLCAAPSSGGSAYRAAKSNYYFPDDQDFFELRNKNLSENAGAILARLHPSDLQQKRAYRGLITRELTQEQLAMVTSELEEVLSRVVSLPETPNPKRVYSVCALLGERFARLSDAPN